MTDEEYEEDMMYYNWEEQEWMDNRLFYENDLEELEEMPKRERQPKKEKM